MMDEIKQLVSEYNAVQDAQRERLARLYAMMSERRGFRAVWFGPANQWSNCWGHEPRHAAQMVYGGMAAPITKVEFGDEPGAER